MNLWFNGDNSVFWRVPALVQYMPIVPVYGTSVTVAPRIGVAEFGDGYSQRVELGINNSPLSFDLVFNHRSVIIAAVKSFFLGDMMPYDRRPTEWFWMTPPAPYDVSGPLKFISDNSGLKHQYESYNRETLSIKVTQVFDL